MVKNENIQIRDPFIFPNKKEQKYYLFGSTDKNIWGPGTGFDVYIGEDLENWNGPYPVFRPDEDFYSNKNFWAPEVHEYKGRYYMFATFLRKDNERRGTAILVSDSLLGPFQPHSNGPVTPKEWFSLDGTLFIDDEGLPWMVFCHEWVQVEDGQVCAIRLTEDLKEAIGEPIILFSASEAPWTTPLKRPKDTSDHNYVTDGTYMFRESNGELLMLWASFKNNQYAQGISRSVSRKITGPWVHDETPIYQNDGGHGMIFDTFEGKLLLTLHAPNKTPEERPLFIPVDEKNGSIKVLS
ncbi:glycoside hydrolase family 43 protein [Evansella sp. AB-P1]|uniref:glycoside hydrolase family 43 protein n=1 Tax=Evansella sp. AB-P1 TaxID=3037653 RepID=UPI00241E90D0|nr:glycoside hydrolase family 43 protein [Evansella sp. AB-P1]MDG5786204.1 glycoside hydrolase family 43 protein [Evansella sp. AB-P1]